MHLALAKNNSFFVICGRFSKTFLTRWIITPFPVGSTFASVIPSCASFCINSVTFRFPHSYLTSLRDLFSMVLLEFWKSNVYDLLVAFLHVVLTVMLCTLSFIDNVPVNDDKLTPGFTSTGTSFWATSFSTNTCVCFLFKGRLIT